MLAKVKKKVIRSGDLSNFMDSPANHAEGEKTIYFPNWTVTILPSNHQQSATNISGTSAGLSLSLL